MITSFVVVEGRQLHIVLSDCIETDKCARHVKVVGARSRYSAVSLARTLLMNRRVRVAVAISTSSDGGEGSESELMEIEQALADVSQKERFDVFSFPVSFTDSASQVGRSLRVVQMLAFLREELVELTADGIDELRLTSKSWHQLNERRSSLIQKRFAEALTSHEEMELAFLEQTADDYVSRIDMLFLEPAQRFQREANRVLSKHVG